MTTDLDVAVIGAGFAGLAALHGLRERGLRVRAYDEAANVGGTWWWHAYPGSHLDTESHRYQYAFSEALYRDWGWSERYPAGYEVQRWFRFVADRLDLRRDLVLGTRVVEAVPDDGSWRLRTDRGDVVRAHRLVACVGRAPVEPAVDVSGFAGPVLRTAAWREDRHDLAGQRVGIVGTGAAAIQLAPWIVDEVASLVVVADAPRDVVRRENPLYGWRERDDYRSRFAELQRLAEPEPLVPDRAAMRARLGDPRAAALLVPAGHGARTMFDDGWCEALAREHVELVGPGDLVGTRPEGLALADGTGRALDVLVVADEFDTGPPALAGIGAHPSLVTVVATPGRTPCVDLQEQVAAVVGTLGG